MDGTERAWFCHQVPDRTACVDDLSRRLVVIWLFALPLAARAGLDGALDIHVIPEQERLGELLAAGPKISQSALNRGSDGSATAFVAAQFFAACPVAVGDSLALQWESNPHGSRVWTSRSAAPAIAPPESRTLSLLGAGLLGLVLLRRQRTG
jgi:hypothetical protein